MAFIPDEAVDRMTELSAGAWRLYCFLARCRNGKTGKCFPSVRTTAEAIKVHPKNIFKLRKELTAIGWAKFDGDHATGLFGFESSKNATADVVAIEDRDESSKNTTIGSKNATFEAVESQKHHPAVAKTLPDGSKNATPIKEEPAKEPAKRERETPVDEIASALCDLYRVPDTAGWRLKDKFQHLAIELHGVGASVGDVKSFHESRQKKPGVEFFLGDFVAWRASQNGTARDGPTVHYPPIVTAPADYRKPKPKVAE